LFENRKIAFIGPGVMAEAMIGGIIHQGVAKPEALIAAGPGQECLEQLAHKFGISVTSDNAAAARQADDRRRMQEHARRAQLEPDGSTRR